MEMDRPGQLPTTLKLLLELWPLFFFLGSVVISATLLFLQSRFTSRKDCDSARKGISQRQKESAVHLDREAGRLRSVEATLKNLPTSHDIAALELTMERLTGRVRELEAVVAGQRDLMRRVESQLDRVDTYLRGVHA